MLARGIIRPSKSEWAAPFSFVVRTDHRQLQWLKDLKNPSTRLARWLIIARQFAFRIEFVSGTQNAAADVLSRFFLFGGEEVGNVEEPGIE